MNIIKRLAVKAIFSKEQRSVIAQSIAYSEHKYRQHGDVDGAIKVGIVRKEVEKAFVVKNNRKYSAKEVNEDECGIYDILFKGKEGSEAPDCGNENCEKRNTCDRQYDNCPSYIAPTPEGGEEKAPEGECDTVGTASAAKKITEEEPKAE